MDEELSPLTVAGLYMDAEGRLVIKMLEFLAAHGIADSPPARRAVLEEIRRQFGDVSLREEE